MTASEAIAGLASIVGSTGVAGILVAYFGYKAQAAKGRKDAPPVLPSTLSYSTVDGKDVELLTNAVSQLSGVVSRYGLVMEWHFIEQTGRHEEFRRWSEDRELMAEVAALRAERVQRAMKPKADPA